MFVALRHPLQGGFLALVCAAACESPSIGVPPPGDQLFFPGGVLLDPRPVAMSLAGEPIPARWLFVSSANSDRSFSGGAVAVYDLEKFFSAWYDPTTGRGYPYCEGDGELAAGERCVQPPGAPVDEVRPCRHIAGLPQVIECDEGPFVVDAVRVGNFATRLAPSFEPGGDPATGRLRLWLPVRGDPSIAFIDVGFEGAPNPSVTLDCGQGTRRDPGHAPDCAESHRLRYVRGDPERRLQREPFNILVDEGPGYRYAYVAHASGASLTRIDLGDASRGPEIVEQLPVFSGGGLLTGGYGLAGRPCFAAGEGPLGDADPEANVPSLTKDCERPLVYGGFRYARNMASFTVTPLEGDDYDSATGLRALRIHGVGGFDPGPSTFDPILGDMAFADPRGDELLIVQTNPGGLLQIDTSLDASGEPADLPAAPPIEICTQPTTMELWNDGIENLAFIACFKSAYIFVVDLDAFRVVASLRGGTGPHALEIDPVREFLYASNTLEATVSVIDVSRRRPTRFTEVARLGLVDSFGKQ